MVTTSWDLTARTWDINTRKTIAIYSSQNSARLGRLTFSPDGKVVVAGANDGTVHIWDPFSGKGLRIIKGHTDDVYGLAFSPDGEFLVTCGHDGTVRLWDVTSGKEIRRFNGHTSPTYGAAFSPDGRYILTASFDHTARLWLADLDDTIQAICVVLTRDLTPDERTQVGISESGPTCPAQ